MQPEEVIILSSGYAGPEVFPTAELSESAARVLRQSGDIALQYGPRAGLESMRRLIADWLIEDGCLGIVPEGIAVLTGAKQGLDLASRVLASPGDTIYTGSPTYMNGLKIFRAAGLHVEGIPVDQNGLDTDQLESKLEAQNRSGRLPAFVYTIPDFHNPTGVVMSAGRRAYLADLAARYRFWVVEDNPYRFIRIDGDPIPPLQSFDEANRVISIGSFAKLLGPGLRVGWLTAAPDVLARLLLLKAEGGTSPLVQMLIEDYFSKVKLSDHLQSSTKIYREKRDTMDSALKRSMPSSVRWDIPEGGYYIWITADGVDTDILCERGVSSGVKAYQGSVFFPESVTSSASLMPKNNLRLAYAYETRERITKGVDIIARLIERKE
jgi:2-aminoadipate transaminase